MRAKRRRIAERDLLTVLPSTRPRDLALSVLEEVDRGRRLDVAWEAAASTVPPADRRWVHEAVFGTIRLRGRIDHLLDARLHQGIASLPESLLRILRLGAYQLVAMGSVPDYAAVSQAVSQARAAGGTRAAGLVNAVLRRFASEGMGPERFPSFEQDAVGYLSSWGSHPRWLVERWVARFGAEGARKVVEAGNQIPSIFLKPIGGSTEDAAHALATAAIGSQPGPEGSGTLRLPPGVDPLAVLGVVRGIIQDPAAARVTHFIGVRPGDRVADLCAAPGGKGVGLAGLGAWVVAADPSALRLRRMRQTLRRLGVPERLVVARGEDPPLREMDAVLVDAPCTGTGTLARHPDARWRLQPEGPAELARVQGRILDGAAGCVRPGGLLVYSTCTLEEEENEGVVSGFLDRHGAFRMAGEASMLRILPGQDGTDGAFAVRMRRDE